MFLESSHSGAMFENSTIFQKINGMKIFLYLICIDNFIVLYLTFCKRKRFHKKLPSSTHCLFLRNQCLHFYECILKP